MKTVVTRGAFGITLRDVECDQHGNVLRVIAERSASAAVGTGDKEATLRRWTSWRQRQ